MENKKARQTDKQNELTLRKKYKLYSSGNTLDEANNNTTLTNQNTSSSTQQENRQRRSNSRSSSENSKDRRSGSYLHVKGKRKAPQPPLVPNNCRTLSPKTTLSRRKKRQAPQPSTTPLADRSEAELQVGIHFCKFYQSLQNLFYRKRFQAPVCWKTKTSKQLLTEHLTVYQEIFLQTQCPLNQLMSRLI